MLLRGKASWDLNCVVDRLLQGFCTARENIEAAETRVRLMHVLTCAHMPIASVLVYNTDSLSTSLVPHK